jgi:hypothetical protein
MTIKRPKGKVQVWADSGEIYIRESFGRDDITGTVCLSLAELQKIMKNAERILNEKTPEPNWGVDAHARFLRREANTQKESM